MRTISKQEKRVLVFNPLKRLVGIFHSNFAAARAFNIRQQGIHDACVGICISTNKLYFRYLNDDIEVTLDDLGSLNLVEYDKLCGVERVVYQTKRMDRTGMKYNTKKKRAIETQKQQQHED